jgi:hypothetical protein
MYREVLDDRDDVQAELHTRISFEAFCKDSRGEILDEKEKRFWGY